IWNALGGDISDALLIQEGGCILFVDTAIRRNADGHQLLHLSVVGSADRRNESRDQVRLVDAVNQPRREPMVIILTVTSLSNPANRTLDESEFVFQDLISFRPLWCCIVIDIEAIKMSRQAPTEPRRGNLGNGEHA